MTTSKKKRASLVALVAVGSLVLLTACPHQPELTASRQVQEPTSQKLLRSALPWLFVLRGIAKEHYDVNVEPTLDSLDQPDMIKVLDDSATFLRDIGIAESAGQFKSSVNRVWENALMGSYIRGSRIINVRTVATETIDQRRARIVHLASHFIRKESSLVSFPMDDSKIAALATAEADAILSSLAYRSLTSGRPLTEILNEPALTCFQLAGIEVTAHDSASDRNATDELLLAYRELIYGSALQLARQAYFEGGFLLMDDLVRNPPESTAQLLHPEKLVAHELPEQCDLSPKGSPLPTAHRSSVGEFLTARAVAGCGVSRAEAEQVATRWRGDLLLTFRRDAGSPRAGSPTSLWLSSWEDNDSAIAFEAMLRRRTMCWNDDGQHAIVRQGGRVLVAVGKDRPSASDLNSLAQFSSCVSRSSKPRWGRGAEEVYPPHSDDFILQRSRRMRHAQPE